MSFPGRHFARILVERRALPFQLVRRDFPQRFVGSAAGWATDMCNMLVEFSTFQILPAAMTALCGATSVTGNTISTRTATNSPATCQTSACNRAGQCYTLQRFRAKLVPL
jgi:hypothetical protein